MSIVKNGQIIGKYTVQSIIKENAYTETYRAEDEDGNAFFFKLFVMKRMPEKLLNPETGKVCEIEYCQKLNHRGIASYVNSGTSYFGSLAVMGGNVMGGNNMGPRRLALIRNVV